MERKSIFSIHNFGTVLLFFLVTAIERVQPDRLPEHFDCHAWYKAKTKEEVDNSIRRV